MDRNIVFRITFTNGPIIILLAGGWDDVLEQVRNRHDMRHVETIDRLGTVSR